METGTECILVVEDDPTVMRVTSLALRQAGFQVIETSAPEEALELLLARPDQVQLIVTDVSMPTLTGPELAKALEASVPNLPCLFLSGHDIGVLEGFGINSETKNFLHKPFRIVDLVSKCKELIANTTN